MIASLLQGQQQKAEQGKHDAMSAMLGQVPNAGGAPAQQSPGAGIMGMAGQLAKGMGGAKKPAEPDSDDMLQGMYGDKENAPDDEDLLNMKV